MRKFLAFALVSLCLHLSTQIWPVALAAAPSDAVPPPKGSSPNPASTLPAGKHSSERHLSVGLGAKVSTLGIGGEVAFPATPRSNLRFGFQLFNYTRTFNKDGITYRGTLNLRSVEALYDFFLIGGLRVSPGVLLYNGNDFSAKATVPGGKSFTLNNVDYFSDPANPITGTGRLDHYKTAPMVLLGFGNLVRGHRHFTVSFELGAAYQGPPRTKLDLAGNVCDASGLGCRSISSDPTAQSNIVTEENKINKNISPLRFYPIVSLGLGWRF